jgi:ABC-2 type transport system ATP-binding protein
MSDFALETTRLKKRFGDHAAVDGLDLAVPAGSIFGFLGRNGAGKTTTIRLLLGTLRADGGTVQVLGKAIHGPAGDPAVRQRIGYVSESKYLYPYMTVRQMIAFTRPFFPTWRDRLERRCQEIFELPPNRRVSALSKGMRTGLMLLLAISHAPDLLILDEPIEGLDPAVVDSLLRELVALPAAEGCTVFFSSHQLAEVEQIADRIAIIDHGRAVVAGSLDDLKTRYQRLRVVFDREPAPVDWGPAAHSVHQEGRTVSILATRNADDLVDLARCLPGASVERFPVGLKEIFLEHARGK